MKNFYEITMVVEEETLHHAECLCGTLIDETRTNNVWMKNGREMTEAEILEFFEKTKEELTN